MTIQYETEEERTLHSGVIIALASHYHLEESSVREIYEAKLEELKHNARIITYLPVLVERHVKNYIHVSQAGG
jgi:Protein of unknown function (DUF3562)